MGALLRQLKRWLLGAPGDARKAAPPIEENLPKPSVWPAHSGRAEARIARLMYALRKYKAQDPDHPKIAPLRAELARLTGVRIRPTDGAVLAPTGDE